MCATKMTDSSETSWHRVFLGEEFAHGQRAHAVVHQPEAVADRGLDQQACIGDILGQQHGIVPNERTVLRVH